MRMRIALLFGLVAALAVGLVTMGRASSAFKVTGGGQTTVSTTGAGDTIAFTAQNTGDGTDARGQIQYIDREEGRVVGIFHGTVTCLRAVDAGEQGAAQFAGVWTSQGEGPFEVYVEDNGEPNHGADQVFLTREEPGDCAEDDPEDDDGETALGRGNVQVHPVE